MHDTSEFNVHIGLNTEVSGISCLLNNIYSPIVVVLLLCCSAIISPDICDPYYSIVAKLSYIIAVNSRV